MILYSKWLVVGFVQHIGSCRYGISMAETQYYKVMIKKNWRLHWMICQRDLRENNQCLFSPKFLCTFLNFGKQYYCYIPNSFVLESITILKFFFKMLDWDNGEISTRKWVWNCCAFIWCSICCTKQRDNSFILIYISINSDKSYRK